MAAFVRNIGVFASNIATFAFEVGAFAFEVGAFAFEVAAFVFRVAAFACGVAPFAIVSDARRCGPRGVALVHLFDAIVPDGAIDPGGDSDIGGKRIAQHSELRLAMVSRVCLREVGAMQLLSRLCYLPPAALISSVSLKKNRASRAAFSSLSDA